MHGHIRLGKVCFRVGAVIEECYSRIIKYIEDRGAIFFFLDSS